MEIKFISTNKDVTKFFQPTPAKKVLPEWFTKLDLYTSDSFNVPTIKSCIPVTDLMTSGYIIFNTYEIDLQQVPTDTPYPPPNDDVNDYIDWRTAADTFGYSAVEKHYHAQCPVTHTDNRATDYFKIKNIWTVKTPPGYSCLFMQPFYHFNKDYKLLPAIVDTDKHDVPISFTGYLTNLNSEITIKPGEPLVQVIPFKRDEWTMSVSEEDRASMLSLFINRTPGMITRWYKNIFHSKKKFE
jgi:hypothetical protein